MKMLVLYDPESGDVETDNLEVAKVVGPFNDGAEAIAWREAHAPWPRSEYSVYDLTVPGDRAVACEERSESGHLVCVLSKNHVNAHTDHSGVTFGDGVGLLVGVVLEGGLVQAVRANMPVQYVVADLDLDGADDDDIRAQATNLRAVKALPFGDDVSALDEPKPYAKDE